MRQDRPHENEDPISSKYKPKEEGGSKVKDGKAFKFVVNVENIVKRTPFYILFAINIMLLTTF